MLDQKVDISVIKLGYRSAFPANQKLTGVGAARNGATNKSIDRFHAVDQVRLVEKIKCPLDRRWRRLPAILIEAVQNIVCADRLVTVPDEFEDTAA